MNLPPSSETFVSLVDSLGPAVARVEAPRQAGVTGLLLDGSAGEGLVLTAHHALRRTRGEQPLRVTLGEQSPRDARLLGRDPATDLAVLQLEGDPDPPIAAPKWRPGSSIRVGELGLALARPGRTVRAGLGLVAVVGDALQTRGGRILAPYIELDRVLPRGFNVAPVVDLEGQILGLATAGLTASATVLLTSETVRAAVDAIVAHGRVPQGFFGVGVSPARLPGRLAEQVGQPRGLAVVGVVDDGPAARAGLMVGDVILTVGDAPVRSASGLRAQLADRAGQPVVVRLLRGGETTDLSVTAGERQ